MIRLADPARIGPALGELRRLLGLTQRQVCAESDLRQSRISVWESGAQTPDLDSVIRYSRTLGYDLALIPKEDT